MSSTPIFIGTPKSYGARINASTSAATIVTGATNGTRVEELFIYNDHTASVVVNVIIGTGTDYTVRQFTVPSKGTINVLQELFQYPDKQFFILQSTHTLKYQTPTSTANNVDAYAAGGDY